MTEYRHYGKANAGAMTDEERAAWAKRVKASFAERRSRGEIEGAVEEVVPSDALEELEQDAHAGRVLKWDLRLSPEEKLRWNSAARALGLTASEFVRDVVNSAAAEILADEGIPEPLLH